MVLPIFTLVIALIFHTFITSSESLNSSFYIESILVLVFSIYFIFYLIYKGFDTKITDSVSKVFTREYLYKYLKKELKDNKNYTLVLISIDNLNEINSRYGIKNGDKVLFEVAKWIGEYFKTKEIINFPLGHIKGGDFIIGLKGNKANYKTRLELMFLKADELKVDDIEVQISGAINDNSLSSDIYYLIENLFELQNHNQNYKLVANLDDEMNPSELESHVINAIKKRDFELMTQDVFEKDSVIINECFIKLKTQNSKLIHPKKYMKVLDKLRLMVDYDLMILEENIKNCKASNRDIFAIPISPTSIRNQFFLTRVKELINGNSNAKNRIIFLLSEKEYYSRIEKYNMILQSLRKIGIKIAIDRLGSIHTSFLYLRDLDIDMVRFDSYYTKDINENKNKSVINGFNIMAHQKGVKTWIKMVENEDEYNLSKELDIDYMQGKYIASLKKL
ncbi:GGDEF domain-containing protein [Candidatus Sulfurimonas marisnigri]|uniref:GGDEF domain-containing protein n=2 Tax=Candidatus Sulfurimonas marisnigri TaxID=2740405 RepID=A0A7S7M2F9_9BACT|nr:GGDEF domain-containing protein [Candidatus Sulfurimonas marisnigri]